METQILLSWCEWRKMVRSDRKKEKEEKEGQRGRERGEWEGDRQRLGPTYNREHERAQNVPQWGPGDGGNRRHHALEPRQPTLTITTATHTSGTDAHMDLQAHTHSYLTSTVVLKFKLQYFHSECGRRRQNWKSSFFYQAAVTFSTTAWWFWHWLFTASGLQEW